MPWCPVSSWSYVQLPIAWPQATGHSAALVNASRRRYTARSNQGTIETENGFLVDILSFFWIRTTTSGLLTKKVDHAATSLSVSIAVEQVAADLWSPWSSCQ